MGKYPDHETYQALYARYHGGRDTTELLRLLEPLSGKKVLDLCGGDGRLALQSVVEGADEAVLVDASATMVPPSLREHPRVRVYIHPVENFLPYAYVRGELFDRIVCRQAVNYWLSEDTASNIARVLQPGGIFVFNTFNQEPSTKPRTQEYELAGHRFVEVSWLVEKMVHHLQIREGMVPHYTTFAWLSPERLQNILEPHFVINEERRGKTSLYRCEKK